MRNGIFALALLFAGHAHATGEINVLTDLMSPFPPGCIAVSLPSGPGQSDLLVDAVVNAPSVGSNSLDSEVWIRVWRVGCHDEGFSIVMVRLQTLQSPDNSYVLIPQVWADIAEIDLPLHAAQLIRHPAVGEVSAAGSGAISDNGTTFMLGVDPISVNGEFTFLPEDYNDVFTLELFWGDFSPTVAPDGVLFTIDWYVPEFDLPQSENQQLHGRMAGGYGFEGIPFTGMHLSVAELPNDTNFISIIFFTYWNGEPFWLIGNAPNVALAPNEVTVNMMEVTGGEFFAFGPGTFTDDDIIVIGEDGEIGTVTLKPIDCNHIAVEHDFSGLGVPPGELIAFRQISIAGYDCNPWVFVE